MHPLASRAMRRPGWILALCALSLVLAGCTGGRDAPTPATSSTCAAAITQRPSSTAKLTIVQPTNGEVVKGSTVVVRVSLEHARIVRPVSTCLVPNEGHLHVKLDGALFTMTGALTTSIPHVRPGHHLVEVDFVANDHGPFDPNVVAVATFNVAA
jgi:Family of unknown function (DUF6130)